MRRILSSVIIAAVVAATPSLAMGQGRGGANKAPKATRPAGAPAQKSARPPQTPKVKVAPAPRATTKPANANSASGKTRSTTRVDPRIDPRTTSVLPSNPRLVERLRLLLPPGTDMNLAASGFRNQGQFVAAVHVSNNLGILFTDLRSRMVNDGLSLGQAIQVLRPTVDADREARRAVQQAEADLGASTTTTSTKSNRRKPR